MAVPTVAFFTNSSLPHHLYQQQNARTQSQAEHTEHTASHHLRALNQHHLIVHSYHLALRKAPYQSEQPRTAPEEQQLHRPNLFPGRLGDTVFWTSSSDADVAPDGILV
jgi:hypothetical protein